MSIIIGRYEHERAVSTSLEPLNDLIIWLDYLTSKEYLIDIMTTKHGLKLKDAESRAKLIIPHMADALLFIQQSLSGPQDVAFLPAYYAILNLAKVYIILGPYHHELPKNRWHGAVYDSYGKRSRSLLTERITLKKGGALTLFYKTITGRVITSDRSVCIGDVFSYIPDIGYEYNIATKHKLANWSIVDFSTLNDSGVYRVLARLQVSPNWNVSIQKVALLHGFRKVRGEPNTFVSKPFQCASEDEMLIKTASQVDRTLLYHHVRGSAPVTALAGSKLPMPEEFPLALLFFHMSSVIRYRPEMYADIRQSRYWPILGAARRHCLLKFVLLFWCHINNENVMIEQI